MILERPVAVVSQIGGILCTLFAFILEAEDSSHNDAGKMSTREGTMTAGREAAQRPEEGTNHLANREGNQESINDCIERQEDSPFGVTCIYLPSYRIE